MSEPAILYEFNVSGDTAIRFDVTAKTLDLEHSSEWIDCVALLDPKGGLLNWTAGERRYTAGVAATWTVRFTANDGTVRITGSGDASDQWIHWDCNVRFMSAPTTLDDGARR